MLYDTLKGLIAIFSIALFFSCTCRFFNGVEKKLHEEDRDEDGY